MFASDDPLFAPVLKSPLQLAPLAPAVGNARNKDPTLMVPDRSLDHAGCFPVIFHPADA